MNNYTTPAQGWMCDKCNLIVPFNRVHACPPKPRSSNAMKYISAAAGHNYVWSPQADLTAYELALCLPLLLRRVADYAPPEGCERHFKKVEGS